MTNQSLSDLPYLAGDTCLRCGNKFKSGETCILVSPGKNIKHDQISMIICANCIIPDPDYDIEAARTLYFHGDGEPTWPFFYSPHPITGFLLFHKLVNGKIRVGLHRGYPEVWTKQGVATVGWVSYKNSGYSKDYGLFVSDVEHNPVPVPPGNIEKERVFLDLNHPRPEDPHLIYPPLVAPRSFYLSPSECFQRREMLAHILFKDATSLARRYETNTETFFLLSQVIARAPIFWWRDDLFKAAINGSEIFEGKFPKGRLLPEFQLWLPEHCFYSGTSLVSIDPIIESGRTATCIGIFIWDDKRNSGLHVSSWNYLHGAGRRDEIDYNIQIFDNEHTSGLDPVMAALEFMNLPIVRKEEAKPPRCERRRLEKEGKPSKETYSMIALRRTPPPNKSIPSNGEHHMDYNCQWMVSPHWRNQWYASLQEHKPIFIHPYLKGPEDKPLKSSRSIYGVIR
jgi:hypothetical protein